MGTKRRAVRTKRYVILGAGAAGLSLCHALLERGVTDEIVILDRKMEFADDRTWCFWDSVPHPFSSLTFSSLASHCWPRWDVVGPDGRAASQTSRRVGYACLRGMDFYNFVCERIRQSPNVTLKLGCPAERVQDIEADAVFDSRPRPVPPSRLSFSQRFLGQFVSAALPVFDPGRCTLMDFRVSQERGLHFMYLLPFSPTSALVENTYIQPASAQKTTPEQHRQEIAAFLAETLRVGSFTVEREEAGVIPMTTAPFPKRDGRVFFIGTTGGCSKPSSGYTFARIQEQCRQIADAVQAGTLDSFRETRPSRRFRFFDTVFLQALWDNPGAFPGYFHRLFSRVPPEALTAFLSETSSWPSDLQIIRALPIRPFLTAARRATPLLLSRPSERSAPG